MARTVVRELHDQLLAEKPDLDHSPSTCPICAVDNTPVEETVKTYTEEELRTAVEAAVEGLRNELAQLKASQEATEIDERIAKEVTEAKTPLEEQITELQAKLDAAVLEAQNEKARADGLEQEKAAAAEQAALEARKGDRLAKVKEVANFPEDYLNTNADRFAAMSDEDFEARLDEYRQIATKATGTDGLPPVTNLKATSESGAGSSRTSAVRELFAMKRAGVDPRTL